MKNKIILFDLDGTILDTAPDLYLAMLATIKPLKHPPIPYEDFRPHVSEGTESMLRASLNIDAPHLVPDAIRQSFLNHYQRLLTRKTNYFPGMLDVLDYFDQQAILWGIVTNKPHCLTTPILAHFGLDKRSQCVVSGDTLSRKKPFPDPLLHACQQMKTDPGQAFYLGDAECDVKAAKAAGMTSIAATYGYHTPENQPANWGADHLITKPLDLLDLKYQQ
jgi:N-acetyl-D-muramate 6-phosphate phosphatase